jgi:hypothetical protein
VTDEYGVWRTAGMEMGKGKPMCLERNLTQCHFLQHRSHAVYPGIESELLMRRKWLTV